MSVLAKEKDDGFDSPAPAGPAGRAVRVGPPRQEKKPAQSAHKAHR
jgi:hypothetical protein